MLAGKSKMQLNMPENLNLETALQRTKLVAPYSTETSTRLYNKLKTRPEFVAICSKCYSRLRELQDKSSTFAVLYGRVSDL